MKTQEEMMNEALIKVLTGTGDGNMRICIIKALDHFYTDKRNDLDSPVFYLGIGEYYGENENYIFLRPVRTFEGNNPDHNPREEFEGIVKNTIKKRIDLEIDLEGQMFIGTLEGVRIQEEQEVANQNERK